MRASYHEVSRGFAARLAPVARVAATLLVLATMVPGGCSRRAGHAPESGGTLHVAVFEPLEPLSPILVSRPLTNEFMDHVLPPLGTLDERATLQPRLARKVYDDGIALECRLRPLRWEDGHPVTAHDLVTTVELLRSPRMPAPERARVERLREAVALDDSTLRLTAWVPYARRQRDALLAPMPSHRIATASPESLDTWPVTRQPLACGPFRVGSWSSRRLVMTRNDASGWPPARLDSVIVRALDYESAARDFNRGAIDVLDNWPADRLDAVRRRSGAQVFAVTGRSYVFVGWNLRDPRLADPVVRRAAARAVDIPRIMRERLHGQGELSRGPLVPALDYTDTTHVFGFDPAAARRELDAAGWRDLGDGVRTRRTARLAFDLLVAEDEPLRQQVAQDVARDLALVGIALQVKITPLPLFVERISNAQFEAFVGHWYPDLGVDLIPVWDSASTDRRNFVGFADRIADSLLIHMGHELDVPARARVLTAFQRRVYDAQPYVFLFQNPRFVVVADRVRAVDPNALSTFWNLPSWWIPRSQQRLPRPAPVGMMPRRGADS